MGPIEFDKYEALGNDFLVVDAGMYGEVDAGSLARAICRRHWGVGADGLLWISVSSDRVQVDVINADGGSAETSGNGLRCAARWLVDRGHAAEGETLPLVSGAGPSPARVDGDSVTVSMGAPRFERPADSTDVGPAPIEIHASDQTWTGHAVSMGNPHLVVFVHAHPDATPLEHIARKAQKTAPFHHGVNVEVARLLDSKTADVRVWERGVGETRACGSGACAVAAAARSLGLTAKEMDVRMPGGTLGVSWTGIEYDAMWLTGPARWVFSGRYGR